jgi:ABC transporter substrate binding protein
VRAQQGERLRRIGILQGTAEGDLEGRRNVATFYQGLQQLGWSDGRNVQFEERWGAGNADLLRRLAAELTGVAPDVFATLVRQRVAALVISTDSFFVSRAEQLGALALRHAVPTILQDHAFVAAGGLMSYGGSTPDSYRLAGVYTGRILKGEKPADLPVQQAVKVELMINLKTAKDLGLTIPETLLATADEVIQ